MAEKDPTKITLTDVRLSFPNVFKPRGFANDPDSKKAYSASALIDLESTLGKKLEDKVLDAIEAAKEKEWGDNPKKWPKVKKANIAIRYGDEDEDGEPKPEEEGMLVVSARNYKQPLVLDRDKTELHESDNVIYGGCYVDMIVRFWAQTYNNIARVNCSLEAVRFRRKGEPFGAAPVDADEFDDLDDEDGDDEGGSRRSSRRRGRDDEDGDEDTGGRRSRGRNRDRDEDDDADERPSRRSRRDKDEDDDADERPSRRSRRDKDEDDDADERPSRRSRRDKDEDDDDRPARRSRRDEEDDDSDDRPARRRSRRNDDDI